MIYNYIYYIYNNNDVCYCDNSDISIYLSTDSSDK